ncbi:hypothetical protein [Neisseria canis]|uniref:Periplasmic protein n=1 Tax=Neisseria canis TaxID=493 RepID=A0A448DBQ5_9NEIS|nr:hypothetical protein [Neisseria canis]OSI12221.1 hypothetical protein BWD07_06490 [Neisseria canis]VEF03611.1 Periplasmic protein [Neisseria canis]
MKWLFAVLVALNVIVFGAVVNIHISKKTGGDSGKELVAEGSHELKVPESALVQKREETPPSWIKTGDKADAKEPAVDETHVPKEKTAEQKAAEEKARLEREKKLLTEKLKKEAAEKARRELAQNQTSEAEKSPFAPPPAAPQNTRCSRTATVTIPEDDYHRIKGLLVQWPHAATRKVEQRDGGGDKRNVKYTVTVSGQGDAQSVLDEVTSKGFNGSIGGGGVVVGIYSDRQSAQATLSRLQNAGFNAQIREQSSGGSSSMSIAKMQIYFSGLSDADIQGVQSVVGKYGNLQRGTCK